MRRLDSFRQYATKQKLLGIVLASFIVIKLCLTVSDRPISLKSIARQTKRVKMEHCDCVRDVPFKPNFAKDPVGNYTDQMIQFNETTCGRDAFERGSGQKIVGYSFYGDIHTEMSKKKGYFEGISGNLRLMPTYYPDWVMRVYYDLDDRDPILQDLCELACENPMLDICNVRHLPGTPMVDAAKVFAMNWRFFPTLDPQVDIYACRDLDSRISAREVAAVEEFLASNQPIHSMRDHPAHLTTLLGASWGTHLNKKNSRGKWKKAWPKMLKDKKTWAPRNVKGPDQEILNQYIWKSFGQHMAVQHDAYLCKTYRGSIPWPTKRLLEPNNFVASVVTENATLTKKCPRACRPKDHPDWEYC